MSLSVGSITVNSDGSYTGTGMAKSILDGLISFSPTTLIPSQYLKDFVLSYANMALGIATGVVYEMQHNASAVISTSTKAGVTTTIGVPINPPTSPVLLAIQ